MLTAREAFKFGFLQHCIESGMTLDRIRGQVKQALFKFDMGAITRPLTAVGSAAAPYALAAPWLAGAAGGWGLSNMTDVDDTDVAEIQKREVIDEYMRQAARLRREKSVRDARLTQPRPVRPFP